MLGGLGEVAGDDACPVANCGLPSPASPFSTVVSLGACSSPAGAGLWRAIWKLSLRQCQMYPCNDERVKHSM